MFESDAHMLMLLNQAYPLLQQQLSESHGISKVAQDYATIPLFENSVELHSIVSISISPNLLF